MSTDERRQLVEEYYTDFREQYEDEIARFDGMYYPPMWVCQTVNSCSGYCIEHLPDYVMYRFIRHQRGRFGAFLSSCEIKAQDNPEITQANHEWWSDINVLPRGKVHLDFCCICGVRGTIHQYAEKQGGNDFRERFNKLRQDVKEWLSKNCDETERERCLQYMEENWDEYQLFHGLPF